MASCFAKLSFIASLLLIFLISPHEARLSTNAATTNDVLSDICSKTTNPTYCLGVLKPAHTTDLKSLVQYTVNLADSSNQNALKLAQSLSQKATNPQLKARYKSCSDSLNDAADDIQQAKQDLEDGDYSGVNIGASAVMTDAEDCQANFKQPPADPSSLLNNVKVLRDNCSIVFVITNLLRTD